MVDGGALTATDDDQLLTDEVAPVREQTFEADEIVLDITPAPGYVGTDLAWQLKTRLLLTPRRHRP